MAGRDDLPDLGPKTDRPRLNPNVDYRNLQLSPVEAFVLSRIDGRTSYDEICKMSSLGRDQTIAILRKLKQHGALLGPNQPDSPPSGSAKHRPLRSPPKMREPKTPQPVVVTAEMLRRAQEKGEGPTQPVAARKPLLELLDDGSAVDAAMLADGPDLSDDLKRRIVRLHRRLRQLKAHELLGLAADADAASVKRAFALASKELHPDRYFGKNLGSFKDKLSQIFARITEAVQELEKNRKAKRA